MKKIDIHLHPVKGDPYMDKYVEIMEKYNVVAGLVHGTSRVKGGNSNIDVLKAVKKYPKKLYGSIYVDFLMPVKKCIDLIKKYSDYGFVSIKLFLIMGLILMTISLNQYGEKLRKENYFVCLIVAGFCP